MTVLLGDSLRDLGLAKFSINIVCDKEPCESRPCKVLQRTNVAGD